MGNPLDAKGLSNVVPKDRKRPTNRNLVNTDAIQTRNSLESDSGSDK